MRNRFVLVLGRGFWPLIIGLLLAACSSGGSSSPEAPAPTVPVAQAGPDFSAVRSAVDRFSVSDVVVLIGDANGTLYRYEKGGLSASDELRIASATKLITGLGVWSLIESGTLELSSSPGALIPFWTQDASDPRADVTLAQLLAFTSGFNQQPFEDGCPGSWLFSLYECIEQVYAQGLDTEPGTAYAYGPEHMQIAALMVQQASGRELSGLIAERLFQPLGLSETTTYLEEVGDNVRYSGAMVSSAQDYALVLQALLADSLFNDQAAFLTDRTASVSFAYRPPAITDNNLDWHYGLGYWFECDTAPFTPACANAPTISSPGAFGFTPWIDFAAGYWGIIAMEEDISLTFSPSQASVMLEQELQPLIEQALNR